MELFSENGVFQQLTIFLQKKFVVYVRLCSKYAFDLYREMF